jgi:hypothetical protein
MIAFSEVAARVSAWHCAERRRPQPVLALMCSGTTAGHDNRNARSYLAITDDPTVLRAVTLCDGCRAVYGSMGLTLNPDRRR